MSKTIPPSEFFIAFGFVSFFIAFFLMIADKNERFDFELWQMLGFIVAGVGLFTIALIFILIEKREKDIKK